MVKQEGDFQIFPVTWTVTGSGSAQHVQGGLTSTVQWNTNVPATSVVFAFRENYEHRLFFQQWGSQGRVEFAHQGMRQSILNGAQQQPAAVAQPAWEWRFKQIEVDPNSPNPSGTFTVKAEELPAGMNAPPDLPPIANCTWNFSRTGSAAATQAPATTVQSTPPSNAVKSVGGVSRISPGSVGVAQMPPAGSTSNSTPGDSTPTSQTNVSSPAATQVTTSSAAKNANNQIASKLKPPPPPTGFKATAWDLGAVHFEWQPVTGAAKYRLEGTGIDAAGVYITAPATNATTNHIPPGPGTWKIASVNSAGEWDRSNEASAAAVVRYVPPHTGQWLTKNNGAGSAALAQTHFMAACGTCLPGASFGAVAVALGLPQQIVQSGCAGYGGNCVNTLTYGDSYDHQWPMEAVYSNITEFGTTRTAACWMGLSIPSGSQGLPPRVLCYSNSGNHGLTVIAKDMQYTWFMTFTSSDPNASIFDYKLTTDIVFDSEGTKHAPHACLSCHGGQFSSGRVTGATLLPLDPGMVQVTDTSAQMALNFLGVNQAVMASVPSPAVSRYVMGLYGADPRQLARQYPVGNGTSMWTKLDGSPYNGTPWPNLNFLPPGWTQQADLYKNTIKPYCTMCHLATPANLDFTVPNNFYQNKDVIYTEVCSGHSMPHAEFPYKTFWTKDTGQVFLPGILAGALGKSCP
jgi:hypothetical protein